MRKKMGEWLKKTTGDIASLCKIPSLETRLTDIENRLKAIEEKNEKPLLVAYPPSYGEVLKSIQTTVAGIAKEIQVQRSAQTLSGLQTLGLGTIGIGVTWLAVGQLEQISFGALFLVGVGLLILTLGSLWYLIKSLRKRLSKERG